MAEKILNEHLYGDLLAPDEGYATEFAVGMTYSLGFDALLTAHLAFGMLDDVDEDAFGTPHLLLEAVAQCSGKVVVFCNKGGIAVPSKIQKVHSLLENNIYEVFDKKNLDANFHPKLWLIREVKKDDSLRKQIKLIVTSRNLKFTDTLDCIACLKGEIVHSGHADQRHVSLAEFLIEVAEHSNIGGDRKEAVLGLADDIMKVKEFEVSDPFVDYDFLPFLFRSGQFPDRLRSEYNILVSPFIDKSVLGGFSKKKKGGILITRREYVDSDVLTMFDKVYVCNDEMAAKGMDIHAKMYHVFSGMDSQFLFLGSANATYSAFNRNAEFLLGLRFRHGHFKDKEFLEGFFAKDGKEDRFVQMSTDDLDVQGNEKSGDDADMMMEKQMKALMCDDSLQAVVEKVGDASYSITLTCDKEDESGVIRIAPLQNASDARPWANTVVFEDLDVEQLSEFYVMSAETADEQTIEKIIKIPTAGIPAERDKAIYKGVIRTPKDFYAFLELMLADVPLSHLTGMQKESSSDHGASSENGMKIYSDLYECLLRAAASEPEKIGKIQNLMNRLDADVVPEDFSRLMAHFAAAIQQ